MPEHWQSFIKDDDSSSVYTTDVSISRPREQHNSLFVEDFDDQDTCSREGSKPRGFSVYLDDSRLEVPLPHSDLSSTDSSGAVAESSGNAANRTSVGVTQFSSAVAAYRMVNDSAFSNTGMQTEEDADTNAVTVPHVNADEILSSSPNQAGPSHILPRSIEEASESGQEFSEGNLAQSSVENNLNNQVLAADDGLLSPPRHLDEQSNRVADTALGTAYQTSNDSVEESLVDSLQQRFQDAQEHIDEFNTSQQRSSESSSGMKTVSTSLLIDDGESPIDASSQHALQDMDDVVRMLEDEAELDIPPLSCSTRPSSSADFMPQDFKLSKRSTSVPTSPETPLSPERPWRKSRAPHSPSLLNKILVPTVPEQSGVEIPVLRSVLGSPRQRNVPQHEAIQHEPPRDEPLRQDELHQHEPAQQELVQQEPAQQEPAQHEPVKYEPSQHEPKKRVPPPVVEREALRRPEGLTNSQVDLALESLKEFQEELRLKMAKWEAIAGHGPTLERTSQGYIPDRMPVQRVDSSSLHSSNASIDTRFLATYSIGRILLVFLGCMVVPPFFFMIAVGRKAGFTDYKVMRMITKSQYRSTLLQGFLWDIDVSWFRWSCLFFGVLETLGAFAGIGVGFGVGLGT